MDATAGGTQLTLADDAQATVALPFSFRYYGQPFTSVTVSSNGFLVFGPSPATAWVNSPLPSTAVPNGVVAAYWDDLNPALGGGVWYRSVGTAPNRKLVVSWVGVRHADIAGPISFQAVLEETSNEIVLAYQDTLHGNPAQDHGASATVGIESPDGSLGAQFLYNQPLLAPYQATTALRYTNRAAGPPPPPDLTPPAVPTGLQATAGDRQVALDWADNADQVANYRVYRNGSPVANPTSSAYTDTGLTNGTSYTYRVTALDQAGNESAPSNQVSASPQAPVTPPDETIYRLLQEPFTWVDATVGGTRLTLADDAQATVALPFSFRYYGQPFTSVTVSSNGFLVFGGPAPPPPGSTHPSPTPPSPTASSPPTGTTSTPPSAAASGTATSAPPQTANSSSAGSASATPTPPDRSASKPLSKRQATRSCSPTRTPCTETQPKTTAPPPPSGIESPDGTLGSQFLHNQPLLAPYQATTALRYTNR